MSSKKVTSVGIALLLIAFFIPVLGQTKSVPTSKERLALVAAATTKIEAGNSFYRVHVLDSHEGYGLGIYTATTGVSHPAGPGLNVLYGGGTPWSSFNTIHSFTTGTSYTQREMPGAVWLNPFGTVTPIGTTGIRTTYVLPGPPSTPDMMTIILDVNVIGTTYKDSSIGVTTTIVNNNTVPGGIGKSVEPGLLRVGVRYEWDMQIGGDDGPTFQQKKPDGMVEVTEEDYVAPGFESCQVQDNDVNPTPPTFKILCTVNGPASVTPAPTPPTILKYVAWSGGYGTAFGYMVDPSRIVAVSGVGNDSALLYYFGDSDATALTIPGGGAQTVSASLFLEPGYDYCLVDDFNGKLMRVNTTSGAYEYVDCRKGITLEGVGVITMWAPGENCKIWLNDTGPNPKRPDRNVFATINHCTLVGDATIVMAKPGSPVMVTNKIHDSNYADSNCQCP